MTTIFGYNFNGYYKPVRGNSRLITDNIAVHNCRFNRFGIALGNRATAIKLQTSPPCLAVYSPIPWGPEAETFLDLLGTRNVKYLIAPDIEHHMALNEWKDQYPDATVIGVSPLAKKRQGKGGANIDIQFTSEMANQLIKDSPMPEEFAKEFEAVYINAHRNKELVLYHTPTKSMITADLFVNMPAVEQYKDSGMSSTSGFSYINHYMGVDSAFLKSAISVLLNKEKAMPGLKIIGEWPMDRIIMCHGEIIEQNANEKFSKFFFQ